MAEREKQESEAYRVDIPSPPPRRSTSNGGPGAPLASATTSPVLAIVSYCASSILMTVTNKFVFAGSHFNLNFFMLCVQVRVAVRAPTERARRLTAPRA